MTRNKVLMLLLAASFAAALPARSATTQPAHGTRAYEYASLLTSSRLCKWTTPQSDLLEDGPKGYAQLYKDLGGAKPPEKVSLIDLLNLVGRDGWDLVAIDGGEGPHQYIFKRPINQPH